MRHTAARLLIFAASVALATAAVAQEARDPGPDAPVQYDVSFSNAAHREAQVSVTYRNLAPGAVEYRMSRSSPGRYAIHEFAKNVYSVSAKDGAGNPLKITRSDPYSWNVTDHDGSVTFSYTLYGDRGDGTYNQIDQSHASLNMPAALIWAKGYDDRPIRLNFQPASPDWKIATQLPAVSGSSTQFWAPHLQYLLDSPTELSNFHLREWTVNSGGKEQTIRLAIHSDDDSATVDAYAAQAKAVVDAQIAVFGEAPRFDFGSYTFIANYLPHANSDGMEHRNSTIITHPKSLTDGNFSQIGTLSHEFVHAWLVERIRPADLEPFDYTKADPTLSLWFVEGFTSYYGPLTVRRSGVSSTDSYLANLGAMLSNIVNHSGRAYAGPQEMSLRAPFVDAATSIDPVNDRIFTSYYPYGAIIALGLDLTLRQRFNTDLDAYMRLIWKTYGAEQRDYAPVKPFEPQDLEDALAKLTGDAAFAKTFFDTQIRGSALPDFAPLLAQAGLILRPSAPDSAWLGASRVTSATDGVTLAEIPVPGSPLYAAKLHRGDVITAINGAPVTSTSTWDEVLATLKPGVAAQISYRNRAGSGSVEVTPVANPQLEIVTLESTGKRPTKAQLAFRTRWLGKDKP